MALSNYSELQASVASWATRPDSAYTSKVPDFIRLAEERIGRKLRVSGMVSSPTTLTIVAGQNWVALPSDWLAFKRIHSTAQPRIEYMPPDQLEDLPQPGDATKYSIEGRRLIYGQTPSANLAFDTKYFQRVPALSDSAQTNWLLTESPSLYLYGALLEGAIWMKSQERMDTYGNLFQGVIDSMQSADRAAAVSGSRLRVTPR